MARAVDELERLDNKFDFTNASASEFYVALELVRSDHVALDASLDVCNLVEQIGRFNRRINKRLMLLQEFVCQLAAAGDSARLDQREALPSFAKASIIIFHALKRSGEGTGRTFRTKAQIDPKK